MCGPRVLYSPLAFSGTQAMMHRVEKTFAGRKLVLETGRIVLEGPAAVVAGDPAVTAAYLGG